MNSPVVKHISEWYIKPKYIVEDSKLPYYLSPWDIKFVSMSYGQEGFIYTKPKQGYSTNMLLQGLKDSLALTLVHFYPLAGQLVSEIDEQNHRCLIFVDCNKGPGVKFVHGNLDLTISDILTPRYVPSVVDHFFLDNDERLINYDGHTKPLLMVQVTEMIDGIFLGVSINHMLADGIAFWHFLNCWSEINRGNGEPARTPMLQRWVPDGYGLEHLYIPYTNPDEFTFQPNLSPQIKVRFFSFSSNTIQNLKAKANEQNNNRFHISSFQALLAFVWRSIIRARGLPPHQITHFNFPANSRTRLIPPLPNEYFGNAISMLTASAKVHDLTQNGVGWVAQRLHSTIANHSDKDIRDFFKDWLKNRRVIRPSVFNDSSPNVVQIGGSPQSKLYENEFVILGKPIAIRKANANTYDGKMYVYPGSEGGDSVVLGIWLLDDTMLGLESDHEFMSYVSSSSVIDTTTSTQVNSRL